MAGLWAGRAPLGRHASHGRVGRGRRHLLLHEHARTHQDRGDVIRVLGRKVRAAIEDLSEERLRKNLLEHNLAACSLPDYVGL